MGMYVDRIVHTTRTDSAEVLRCGSQWLYIRPLNGMEQVCIPVPMPAEDETLELEVTIGGTTHLMQYRIETMHWGPDVTPDERIERLRTFIQNYDPAWSLVQIGAPGEGMVPITFRQRRTTKTATDA